MPHNEPWRISTEAYSPKCVERLSGKSLCGSNGTFLGSAKRPKRCRFAPFCRLKGPRNGACSEFPDSLWKGNSPKFACKIRHKPGLVPALRCTPDVGKRTRRRYMLWWRIKMRGGE